MKRILPLAALLGLFVGACDSPDPVTPLQESPAVASPMLVSAGGFLQLSSGHEHTCAVRVDGTVACWGNDRLGLLGVPANLGPATQVSGGWDHTCALLSDGGVTCWGYNGNGQATVPATLRRAVNVDAGGGHSCALQDDGIAVCWGGYSHSGEGVVPPTLGMVEQVSAGWHHTCVLKLDGTVSCWGVNSDGQVNVPPGLTNVRQVSAGENETCVLRTDGSVICWGGRGMGVADPPANLGIVTQVDANHAHACAVKADGGVACWGYNALGATTVPANLTGAVQVSTAGYHTCAVMTDSRVTCWGLAADGRTTPPSSRVPPIATLTAPLGVREGSPIALALANASVPGYIGNAGLTFAFDCGDGAGYGPFGAASSVSCPTVDNGMRTMRATVMDRDGDSNEYTRPVRIENAAPQPAMTGDVWATLGKPYTLTLGVIDPGVADAPWTYAIYWGDETPAATGALQSIVAPLVVTHRFTRPGPTMIMARVTDKDGAMRSRTIKVNVRFPFSGFFEPILATPAVNELTAGDLVPIRFTLGADYGMNVFASTSGVQRVSCDTGARLGDLLRPNIIGSGYEVVAERYEFTWKTDKAYRGSCQRLVVRLTDGTTHTAEFRFR